MRKASDILLLIGAILTFVGLIGLVIGAIVLFIFASPAFTQMIIDGINNGSIHTSMQGSPEEVAAFVQNIFLDVGIALLVCTIPTIIAGVFALIAKRKQDNTSYIVALVLALIFGGNIIVVIGSILGLVENSQNN